jgi:hypothetical protein
MTAFPVETVPIEQLRAHPRNYVVHPPDELEHIKASMYRRMASIRTL